jgi:hypothetical protein
VYSSDGSINSRNELVLVREKYLGGASVTSRNCLSHRRRNWTESRSTKFAVTRMVKLQMQAFGRVGVHRSKKSFDVGRWGESGKIEWVGGGAAKPIEEGVQQEAWRVDWLDGDDVCTSPGCL